MSSDPKELSAAYCTLAKEYEEIMNESNVGFHVSLVNDNLFEWEVGIFGPPNTIYRDGYYRARMRFPEDYPLSPPVVRFINGIYHPNILSNKVLCISNLPTPMEMNARTIILSTISLLSDPNMLSPGNRFVSKLYRLWRDSNGENKFFYNLVRREASEGNVLANLLGIVVPKTMEEYCNKTTKTKPESVNNDNDKDAEAENSNLKNENSSLPPASKD